MINGGGLFNLAQGKKAPDGTGGFMTTGTGMFVPGQTGGPMIRNRNNGGDGGKGDNQSADLFARSFLPGQQDALANQLNWGFGGGTKQWNNTLGNLYSPVQQFADYVPGGVVPKVNDGNNGKDGKDSKGDKNDNVDNTDTWGHDRAIGNMMPSQMQTQAATPMMQPQSPQMGGGLAALNPQTLALLRQIYGAR